MVRKVGRTSHRTEGAHVEHAVQAFEVTAESPHAIAGVIHEKLQELSFSETEPSFGLKATGEFGGAWILAKSRMEVNFSVKMVWKENGE